MDEGSGFLRGAVQSNQINGRFLKLRLRLRKTRTAQPVSSHNTVSHKRGRRISLTPSLSVIFERNKEDTVNSSMEDNCSLLSSVSLHSMLYSSSGDSICKSFTHDVKTEPNRLQQSTKEKMLSSLIPADDSHLSHDMSDESSDDTSSNRSSVNFAVHVRRTLMEDRNDEDLELSDDFTKDTFFREYSVKHINKTWSQISVWSGDTPMEIKGGEDIECTPDIGTKTQFKSSLKIEPSSDVQLVNTLLINVKISNESKDFTEIENMSQNANQDDSVHSKDRSTGNKGSPRSRRSSQRKSNFRSSKNKEKFELEWKDSNACLNSEQSKSKVTTKRRKRVRFEEQHFIINDSYSDSAVAATEADEQQTTTRESASLTDNVNDKEMKANVATFVSSLLSRALFASDKSEISTTSLDMEGRQSELISTNEAADVSSPRISEQDPDDADFLKILNVNHNWRSSENNNSNVHTLPFDLLISMVDDVKAGILRTCGSRYDQGDTFKGRDIAEHRAIQDRLVRLQKLKELLRRARVAEEHTEEEGINVAWLRMYTSNDDEDQSKNTVMDVGKHEDPPKIRSIYRSINGLEKEPGFRGNITDNSTRPKKSNTTLESETFQEEDNCKDNGVNPTQCSRLQSKSNDRAAVRPHTQPTTKDADVNSSSAIPDGSFWKNLNQGKIKDARDYVKEQAPLADDMSKWTAHNMCEMYDDDLWELYKAAESSSDDCSPRSSWERKSIVCYSEASTQLHSSTTGKYTNDGRDSRSTRTANKIHGTGAKKKITKHRKKKKADSDESSDDSSNPTKESKQRKSPKKGKVKSCRRKENLEERKETSSKRFTSKLSGFLEAPIGAKEKKTQKSTTKLKGFLETPLGAKEQPRSRRHIKEEENLEFFRYIARNPGFFRSGTPLPPKEHDGEYNARSFMETTQREYAIDSVTAADNLFFFRTVSRSSHFYSRPSSRNAEFKGN